MSNLCTGFKKILKDFEMNKKEMYYKNVASSFITACMATSIYEANLKCRNFYTQTLLLTVSSFKLKYGNVARINEAEFDN